MTILALRKGVNTLNEKNFAPEPSKSQPHEEFIASNRKPDTQENH